MALAGIPLLFVIMVDIAPYEYYLWRTSSGELCDGPLVIEEDTILIPPRRLWSGDDVPELVLTLTEACTQYSEPSEKQVRLPDGSTVALSSWVVTEEGVHYSPRALYVPLYQRAVLFDFGGIPEGERIKEIHVSANPPIECTSAKWDCSMEMGTGSLAYWVGGMVLRRLGLLD